MCVFLLPFTVTFGKAETKLLSKMATDVRQANELRTDEGAAGAGVKREGAGAGAGVVEGAKGGDH